MRPLDPAVMPLESAIVEASAGTGKTYAITTLVVRLVVERGLGIDRILVVTFTNAATAELRERIRARLRAALAAADGAPPKSDEAVRDLVRRAGAELARKRLSQALYGFDEAPIFTIHGFCRRALSDHAFESGASFEAELVAYEEALIEDVAADFFASRLYDAPLPIIQHVRKAIHPQKSMRLVRRAAMAPDVPFLPDPPPDPPSIEPLWEAFEDAWRAAAAAWAPSRDAVLAVLRRAPLDARNYPSRQLESWYNLLGAALEGPCRPLWKKNDKKRNDVDHLSTFSASQLAENVKSGPPPAHAFFDACERLSRANRLMTSALDAHLVRLQLDLVAWAREELPRRKARRDEQGFDDLLSSLDRALSGAGGERLAAAIRERYPVALVDEFQDTDPIQYRIFRRTYGGAGGMLVLIGDPKQAIYGFRGADVYAYLEARKAAGGERYTLATNRRSDPGMVAAVNALFGRVARPFLLRDIEFIPAAPAPGARARLTGPKGWAASLRILFWPRRRDEKKITKKTADGELPRAIAADVVRLLQSGAAIDGKRVSPRDVAILVRKNDEAAAMQEALREVRVPSVLQGDASVLDAPEAAEMQHVLAALAEPGNARAVRRALATSLFGATAAELARLDADEKAWDERARPFFAWHDRWKELGFLDAFRRMMDDERIPARLLALVDGERRLTNVLHLAELLHGAAMQDRLGMAGLERWLCLLRHDESQRHEVGAEAAQIRLESDDEAVKLLTVHVSKGLEYPIVYCPTLWDGLLLRGDDKEMLRFHDESDGRRLKIAVGAADREASEEQAKLEAAAENMRLLYVALTRARHQCTVVWGRFSDAETSALGYLLHQPLGAAPLDAAAERIRNVSDAELRADLGALAAACPGEIAVEDIALGPVDPWEPPPEPREMLVARPLTRSFETWWRTSSFSALTKAKAETRISPREQEGIDHDDPEESDADAKAVFAAAGPDAGEVTPIPGADEVVPLDEFERGTRAGDVLHAIFERIDFDARDPDVLLAAAAEALRAHGLSADEAPRVARAIDDVLDTPFGEADDGGPLCLRDLPRARRLDEMPFLFPVADAPKRCVSAKAIADVLAAHAVPPIPRDYPERVARLRFLPLTGFLRGYVDLVFERKGRYYVVDYKSNHLGSTFGCYGPAALAGAMAKHHYVLQYLLYAVAVHRHLRARLPGYDYDRHFGGVYYLFVRGMSPSRGAATGVHHGRPSAALVGALSALLDGGAAREVDR